MLPIQARSRRSAFGGLSLALVTGTLLAAGSTPASAAVPSPDDDRTVVTNGLHTDSLYPELVGGELVVNSHLDSGSVAPATLLHYVPDTQKAILPAGFEETLAPAGTEVWIASQTGGDDGPYTGWSTYGLGDLVGASSVDFTLTGVDGPGKVAVTQSGPTGEVVPRFSLQSGEVTVTESSRAHVHANWIFTAPGDYELDFTVTARLLDGSTKTATTSLDWAIGGEVYTAPGDGDDAGDETLTLSGHEDSYTVGETGTLKVTPSDGFAPNHYHWLGKAAGAETFGELDSTSDTYSFVAGPELDGMQIKAMAHGSAGNVETEPVTLHVTEGGDAPGEVELTISTTQSTWLIGQSVKMSATTTPTSSLSSYRWFIQRAGEAAPSEVWGQKTANFSAKPALDWDQAQFFARLYDAGGNQVAQSNTLTFDVEQIPAQGTLAATTDKAQYTVGETAHLSSVLTHNGEVESGHVHWYVQKVGDGAYTWVPESRDFDQDIVLDASYDGASVKVAYFRDSDHAQVAASNVLTLAVAKQATDLSVRARAPIAYGETAAITVAAPDRTGTVTLSGLGTSALSASLENGLATFAVPTSLDARDYQLTASYPGDDVHQAAQASGRFTIERAGVKLQRKLAAQPSKKRPGRLQLTAKSTTGAAVTGKVVITLTKAGTTKKVTVKLRAGRATTRLPKLGAGAWKARATYAATTNFERATKKFTVRVR